MAGVTEKRKRASGGYLLLHRSGAVAKTRTLNMSQPLNGIMAVVKLDTLEQLTDDDQWEKIPDGCDILIEAEQEEEALEEQEQEAYDDLSEEEVSSGLQFGARRYYNPHIVWAYCRN
jgi:hypothetical protein